MGCHGNMCAWGVKQKSQNAKINKYEWFAVVVFPLRWLTAADVISEGSTKNKKWTNFLLCMKNVTIFRTIIKHDEMFQSIKQVMALKVANLSN